MRVLVCGGRDFGIVEEERAFIFHELHSLDLSMDDSIISGMSRGADSVAASFAEVFDLGLDKFPADWNKYGKAAGFIRNTQMLEEGKPDLVIAFPGGNGTAMMVKIARAAGVEVKEIEYNGTS